MELQLRLFQEIDSSMSMKNTMIASMNFCVKLVIGKNQLTVGPGRPLGMTPGDGSAASTFPDTAPPPPPITASHPTCNFLSVSLIWHIFTTSLHINGGSNGGHGKCENVRGPFALQTKMAYMFDIGNARNFDCRPALPPEL